MMSPEGPTLGQDTSFRSSMIHPKGLSPSRDTILGSSMIPSEGPSPRRDTILELSMIPPEDLSLNQDTLPRSVRRRGSETLRAIRVKHATNLENNNKLGNTGHHVASAEDTESFAVNDENRDGDKAEMSDMQDNNEMKKNCKAENSELEKNNTMLDNNDDKKSNSLDKSDKIEKSKKLDIKEMLNKNVIMDGYNNNNVKKSNKTNKIEDNGKIEGTYSKTNVDKDTKSDKKNMTDKCRISNNMNKERMQSDACCNQPNNDHENIAKIRVTSEDTKIYMADIGEDAEDTFGMKDGRNIGDQKCKNGRLTSELKCETENRNISEKNENMLNMVDCAIKNEDTRIDKDCTKIAIEIGNVKRDTEPLFHNEESRKHHKRSVSLGDISCAASPPRDPSILANRRSSGIGDLSSFPGDISLLANRRPSLTGDHKIRAIRVKHSNASRIQMERRKSLREFKLKNSDAPDAEQIAENNSQRQPTSNASPRPQTLKTPHMELKHTVDVPKEKSKHSLDTPKDKSKHTVDAPKDKSKHTLNASKEQKSEESKELARTSESHFVNTKLQSFSNNLGRRNSTGGDLNEQQKTNQHFKRRNSDNMLIKAENNDGHVKLVLLPPCPTSEPPPLPTLQKNFCKLARSLSKNEQCSTTESDSDHSPTRKKQVKSRMSKSRKCILAPIPKPPSFRRVSCDWSVMLNKVDGLSINEETTEDREESDFIKHSKFLRDESDKVVVPQ